MARSRATDTAEFALAAVRETPPRPGNAVHARHLHLPYYAGFLLLSVTAIALALTAATTLAFGPDWDLPGGWGPFALLGLLAGYLFVAFGFLSRTCERQADIDGARAVSCGHPACDGHSTDTPLSVGRGPVCGTGARTMARALERVVLTGGEGEERGRWRRQLVPVLRPGDVVVRDDLACHKVGG